MMTAFTEIKPEQVKMYIKMPKRIYFCPLVDILYKLNFAISKE